MAVFVLKPILFKRYLSEDCPKKRKRIKQKNCCNEITTSLVAAVSFFIQQSFLNFYKHKYLVLFSCPELSCYTCLSSSFIIQTNVIKQDHIDIVNVTKSNSLFISKKLYQLLLFSLVNVTFEV